jgi:hypothetical protein
MPLESGTTPEVIGHNAGVELQHHRPRKQAWAIAYAYARRHPDGGKPPPEPKETTS